MKNLHKNYRRIVKLKPFLARTYISYSLSATVVSFCYHKLLKIYITNTVEQTGVQIPVAVISFCTLYFFIIHHTL